MFIPISSNRLLEKELGLHAMVKIMRTAATLSKGVLKNSKRLPCYFECITSSASFISAANRRAVRPDSTEAAAARS